MNRLFPKLCSPEAFLILFSTLSVIPLCGATLSNKLRVSPLFAAAAPTEQTQGELLQVVTPKFGMVYKQPIVKADLTLEGDAKPQTLMVRLNGNEVTSLVRGLKSCGESDGQQGKCQAHLLLTAWNGLREGQNSLIVSVQGPNGSQSSVTRRFEIATGGLLGSPQNPPQAVAVSSSSITGDQSSISDFTIHLGNTVYTPSCPAGTTSAAGMQVLVLDRLSLQQVDYQCFNTASDTSAFSTYLSKITGGQLVIAGSFGQAAGSSLSFDTTAIGGTKYGSGAVPKLYSIIGVAGQPGGTAYETHITPTLTGDPYLPTLLGSLVPDQYEKFNFLPLAFPQFKVTPTFGSTPASIEVQSVTGDVSGESQMNTYNAPALPSGATGGFWLLELHRYDLSLVRSDAFGTNGSNAAAEIQNLATALTGAPADIYVFLTSLGTPLSSNGINGNLKTAIDKLGGNGYVIGELADNAASQPTYTLISTTDTNVPRTAAIVSSSLYTAQKQTGIVSGVFSRSHNNLFAPLAVTQESQPNTEDVGNIAINYDMYSILAELPVTWPVPAPGNSAQQAAYSYLSQTLVSQFGCSGNNCSDYRTYYHDLSTESNFCAADPNSVPYPGDGHGYVQADFNAVQSQLHQEKTYVCNVLNLYNNMDLFYTSANTNVSTLIKNAGSEVEGSVNTSGSQAIATDEAKIINLTLKLLKATPDVGQVAAMAQGMLHLATSYIGSSSNGAIPTSKIETTVNDLYTNQVAQFTLQQQQLGSAFTQILTDWGKLSAVGSRIGNPAQYPGFTWTPNTAGALLPLYNLSIRTEFYNDLLPLAYSIDAWYRLPGNDPKVLGAWEPEQSGFYFYCGSNYGGRPDNSYVAYHNMNVTSEWDTYVMDTTNFSPSLKTPHFPNTTLLGTLFGDTDITTTGTTGLNLVKDQLFSGHLLSIRPAIDTQIKQGQNCGCTPPGLTTKHPCSNNF